MAQPPVGMQTSKYNNYQIFSWLAWHNASDRGPIRNRLCILRRVPRSIGSGSISQGRSSSIQNSWLFAMAWARSLWDFSVILWRHHERSKSDYLSNCVVTSLWDDTSCSQWFDTKIDDRLMPSFNWINNACLLTGVYSERIDVGSLLLTLTLTARQHVPQWLI